MTTRSHNVVGDSRTVRAGAVLEIRYIKLRPEAQAPRYMTPGSAGMDVCAAISEPLKLESLERVLVPTGLAFSLPEGTEMQVRPRSGLALKHGLTCLNSPGTIDADYRGEVQILLVNLSHRAYDIQPGERIAQLVVAACLKADVVLVNALDETPRGQGGFGHTGA